MIIKAMVESEKKLIIDVETPMITSKIAYKFNKFVEDNINSISSTISINNDNIENHHIKIDIIVSGGDVKVKEGSYEQGTLSSLSISEKTFSAINGVMDLINRFFNAALRSKLKHTEFIPLKGYELNQLKKDIKLAIENKRNFDIVDNYKNYLTGTNSGKFLFNQYEIHYGTSEYADLAININSCNNIKNLEKIYKNKLKKENWL